MKELFVPYEIALQLKEKGFNMPCICGFDSYGRLIGKLSHGNDGSFISWDKRYDSHLPAPLYQQVITWLDSKHVYIDIDHEFGKEWNFYIDNGGTGHCGNDILYKTRIEALEQAIIEALKLI